MISITDGLRCYYNSNMKEKTPLELEGENRILQSNWNSLREYTEQRLKILERRMNTFGSINPDKDTKVLQIYQEYLDKMNDLEKSDIIE